MVIFEGKRDRQNMCMEEKRERETQNLKQDPGSQVSAEIPMWGSNS